MEGWRGGGAGGVTYHDFFYKVISMCEEGRPCIVHNDIQVHSVV